MSRRVSDQIAFGLGMAAVFSIVVAGALTFANRVQEPDPVLNISRLDKIAPYTAILVMEHVKVVNFGDDVNTATERVCTYLPEELAFEEVDKRIDSVTFTMKNAIFGEVAWEEDCPIFIDYQEGFKK